MLCRHLSQHGQKPTVTPQMCHGSCPTLTIRLLKRFVPPVPKNTVLSGHTQTRTLLQTYSEISPSEVLEHVEKIVCRLLFNPFIEPLTYSLTPAPKSVVNSIIPLHRSWTLAHSQHQEKPRLPSHHRETSERCIFPRRRLLPWSGSSRLGSRWCTIKQSLRHRYCQPLGAGIRNVPRP